LKKYKPNKDYEEKMNYMAYNGVLAFFGVIQCSMGEAINSHIKFVQESEKDLLKSNKNHIYSTAFDFFALLYLIFEKKLEERGIDEFSFSDVLKKTYYYYFNEFFSDSIPIYPKHGYEFNQKYNFKSYNEALVQKKMLFAVLIERLRSNLDNKHKLFEAYKTLYAFLVLSPSFYNGNKFDEQTIDIMATQIVGFDISDMMQKQLSVPLFVKYINLIIPLFENQMDILFVELDELNYRNTDISFNYLYNRVREKVESRQANQAIL
jgi:hypothetical protein